MELTIVEHLNELLNWLLIVVYCRIVCIVWNPIHR